MGYVLIWTNDGLVYFKAYICGNLALRANALNWTQLPYKIIGISLEQQRKSEVWCKVYICQWLLRKKSVTDTEEKIDRVITAQRCISQSQNASNTESLFHGKMIHTHPDDKFIDSHNVRFRVLSFIFICWRRPIKLVLVDPQCVELHLISLGIMPIFYRKWNLSSLYNIRVIPFLYDFHQIKCLMGSELGSPLCLHLS